MKIKVVASVGLAAVLFSCGEEQTSTQVIETEKIIEKEVDGEVVREILKESKTVTSDNDNISKEVNIEVQVVGQDEFETAMNREDATLIDVRTKAEFEEGHIDGAINKDFKSGEFQEYITTLDKSKPVLVYCHAGGRSGKSRELLEENEFEMIFDLDGGFSQWK